MRPIFFSKTGIFGFSKETTGSEGNAGGTTAGIGGGKKNWKTKERKMEEEKQDESFSEEEVCGDLPAVMDLEVI